MPYTLEIEVNQPRAKVVELFDNPDNLAFWQPGYASYKHESGESGKPGATARIRYLKNGRDFDMIETITVRNLPDEFSSTFHTPGMFNMEVKNFFHEAGPDKTRWVTENSIEAQGIMMKVMMFFMPGCGKKESWKFMEYFKVFAETGADVRKMAR